MLGAILNFGELSIVKTSGRHAWPTHPTKRGGNNWYLLHLQIGGQPKEHALAIIDAAGEDGCCGHLVTLQLD